jgi:large subunit ribosomal protein L15
MPLYRRLPKRGFLPHGNKREFALVKVGELSAKFAAGSVVDPDALTHAGLIKKSSRGAVKVLGDGDIQHSLTVKVHRISESARRKLEAAGGLVEVLPS